MGTVFLLDLLGCLQGKQGSWEVYHMPEVVPGLLHAISHLTPQPPREGHIIFFILWLLRINRYKTIEVLA